LSASGFEAWVLQEALSGLVAGASQVLHELSGGAYSLGINDQREFIVIDHREADAVRPARTLSGGETFQASLALALALADHLAEFAIGGMSKLESIFLDEGFGTLDEDSLDVVASTLESLSSGSRVVGVVTHVKELAARVPVRYEVRRVGRTATVEKVLS
jgi:exonuclease SbcC